MLRALFEHPLTMIYWRQYTEDLMGLRNELTGLKHGLRLEITFRA